jgi:hypothetical protein
MPQARRPQDPRQARVHPATPTLDELLSILESLPCGRQEYCSENIHNRNQKTTNIRKFTLTFLARSTLPKFTRIIGEVFHDFERKKGLNKFNTLTCRRVEWSQEGTKDQSPGVHSFQPEKVVDR